MFNRVLIANRGEIACRVIRTAQAMGVATVAVHSDVDAGALHVELADDAVCLGGATPQESYLKGDAIIEAALARGAQAIHPGDGFLSENPDFVGAVEAAGLTFIGPSADAIRAMGLKDAAKALMEKAGVPVVPGYHGADQDPDLLASEAEKIGYPVLIKAVAGGGGKGMRLVEAPDDFVEALRAAQNEARGAFGNDAVLIEKFVSKPRHIEVQIFGDGTKSVHLYERDCSLQRRHQKVIEEAPAPGMTEEIRTAMGTAAVRAAEAIGYAGAGTVEFIVDASEGLHADRFWFMEMNTRLQVEHPVTEAVTGIDLVEWQLRVAAGEPLPLAQEDIPLDGHAFEARLYAEDVPAGFLPATGRLWHLAFPEDARADSGVRAGDEISPFYDPMIAKVVAHGATRDIALRRFAQAMAGTEVAGCTTNHGFLRGLIRHESFQSGDVDTGLIDRDVDDLAPAPVPCSRTRSLAAIGALGLDQATLGQGFTLWAPQSWEATFDWGDEPVTVRVTPEAPGVFTTQLGETTHKVARKGDAWWFDDVKSVAKVVRQDLHLSVFFGNGYHFRLRDPLARDTGGDAAQDVITAPMPGLIRAMQVEVGQEVAEGDPLAILEAMKMEHVLRAPGPTRVAEVLATEGDQVTAGAALIRFEAEKEA